MYVGHGGHLGTHLRYLGELCVCCVCVCVCVCVCLAYEANRATQPCKAVPPCVLCVCVCVCVLCARQTEQYRRSSFGRSHHRWVSCRDGLDGPWKCKRATPLVGKSHGQLLLLCHHTAWSHAGSPQVHGRMTSSVAICSRQVCAYRQNCSGSRMSQYHLWGYVLVSYVGLAVSVVSQLTSGQQHQ